MLDSDGHTYVLGRPDRSPAAVTRAFGAAGSGTLRAPMPGVVVRIIVAAGDRVAARQPLLVLEAMKMEHILESSIDGVVATIACREGLKVAEGDVLIEVHSGATDDATA